MTRFLILFLLAITSSNEIIKSQPISQKHLISQIDYVYKSGWDYKGGKGFIKYQYNPNGQLIGMTLIDANNLNNVLRVKIKYLPNQIVINDDVQPQQTLTTDNEGKIFEGSYHIPASDYDQFFTKHYKFNYQNGYLTRINSYNGDQLFQIHSVEYDNGNPVAIKNTFNSQSLYKVASYQIGYNDIPNTLDINFLFGIYLEDQTERFPLFGFPGMLLGQSSKNLIKSINAIYNNDSMLKNPRESEPPIRSN